ncbi:MAG: pyrroline-5-carboxylate reductase dimerization domain-containing protein [Oscillospiraceae bacterium]|nr:pyrroline-5-carboxylate reductase dimerization domain-containing protein [Oscillospiraceae bacterium]
MSARDLQDRSPRRSPPRRLWASGAFAMNSSEHPIALMNAVCSPGGTTIEDVCKLRELGFDTAV